jgi:hypothetical protein
MYDSLLPITTFGNGYAAAVLPRQASDTPSGNRESTVLVAGGSQQFLASCAAFPKQGNQARRFCGGGFLPPCRTKVVDGGWPMGIHQAGACAEETPHPPRRIGSTSPLGEVVNVLGARHAAACRAGEETPHLSRCIGTASPLGEAIGLSWRAPARPKNDFPLRGERVARHRRFHQPGSDG